MKKMPSLLKLPLQDAQQTFTVQNKPAMWHRNHLHHFFVSGWAKKTVRCNKICGGAENVDKTETQQTFVNGLLGFITLEHLYSAGSAYVLLTIIA